ncbi:nucleic acid-binding protein [Cadophora sp. DSE1049]|nr:nucleic acid-binding protein [Cadophora sp. DSE1049]
MSTPKVVASATRQINAVVVSAGLMQKTVKARVGVQKWNGHIKKHFNRSTNVLVHDPNSSLRIGDIISISPGWRYSKHVHHVVNSIVAPFGQPIEERPAVPTLEERLESREAKRRAKEERRWVRSGRAGSPWDLRGEGEEGEEMVGEERRVEEVLGEGERQVGEGKGEKIFA